MNKLKRTGLIRENFAIAIDVIVEHKLRSGLILLGVAIGVASMMGVVSLLLGLKAGIAHEVGKYEQTVLTVQKYDYEISGMAESFWLRKNVEPKHAKAIKQQCKSANYVAFMISSVVFAPTLHYKNEESRRVSITGAEPSMFYISTLEMDDGRMFTDSEVLHHAKVVILGHSPRRDMFPNIDPIGKQITINDKDFTIVGTLAPRKTIGGDSSDNLALIPYTTFKDVISRSEMNMAQIMVSIREGHSLDEAREEIIQIMRVQRGLKANQDNDFSVATMDTALDLINQITEPVELILVAISSIALLVGGIGVMNMMLVSVTERTAEIGIRKAVGANRRHILWQFIIEAGTLTGIGGVLGLALGLSVAFGISLATDLPFSLSPIFIFSAVAFSIAIGMFFGLYPAYRASNLNPIQAIEYAK
jgi:putative ABC transport system permease protein